MNFFTQNAKRKKIPLVLAFFLFSCGYTSEFQYLKPVVKDDLFSLKKANVNQEYFIEVELASKYDSKVSKVVTSCACLQILQYPEQVFKGKEFKAFFTFKPLKVSTYKINIEFQFLQESQHFHFESDVLATPSENDTSTILPKIIRKIRPINERLYISADKALKSFKDLKFIDIRDKSSYSKLSINNSLNISPSRLKTLSYLQSKNIILVGYGNYSPKLEKDCSSLRDFGFKRCFILEGGLQSWLKAKGLFKGNPAYAYKLPATEFLQSKDFDNSHYVDLTKDQSFSKVIPDLKSIESLKLEKSSQIFLITDSQDFSKHKLPGAYTTFTIQGGHKELLSLLKFNQKLRQAESKNQNDKLLKCKKCP